MMTTEQLMAEGWVAGPLLADVADGTMQRLLLSGRNYLLVQVAGHLNVFPNACAHMGMPLDQGDLNDATGRLFCPWHDWCYDARTGACLTAPGADLEALPLQIVEERIWIKPL